MRTWTPFNFGAAWCGRWLVLAAVVLLAGHSWLGAIHRATAHAGPSHARAVERHGCERHAGCGGVAAGARVAGSNRDSGDHRHRPERPSQPPSEDCGVCVGLATLAKASGVPGADGVCPGPVPSARGGVSLREVAAGVWDGGVRAARGPPAARAI